MLGQTAGLLRTYFSRSACLCSSPATLETYSLYPDYLWQRQERLHQIERSVVTRHIRSITWQSELVDTLYEVIDGR